MCGAGSNLAESAFGGRGCDITCAGFFFGNFYSFIWLCWVFTAVQGLSLVAASRGYSLVGVHRLLLSAACLVAEHGFWGKRSSVAAQELSRPWQYGIFLDQGSNPCPLQVDS